MRVHADFRNAYVISHEVGHHVQNELGILPRVMEAQQAASSRTEANAMQVRIELQADCLAGVWANRSQQKNKFLDPGDLDQALQTASAIGDDRLQKEMQGYVVPDSFTAWQFRTAQALVPQRVQLGTGFELQYAVV
jgi:predicted metalloprotease